MKRFTLPILALLLCGTAFAQTEYDIPNGTAIDYIFYNVTPPYTNTFFSDYPLTVGGLQYSVSLSIHFTAGDPAATSGAITFTNYTPTGFTSVTENLTGINYSPFTRTTATATAGFAGQFNGSLTFNIQQFKHPNCYRDCFYDALTTVGGVHSNFTIQ